MDSYSFGQGITVTVIEQSPVDTIFDLSLTITGLAETLNFKSSAGAIGPQQPVTVKRMLHAILIASAFHFNYGM